MIPQEALQNPFPHLLLLHFPFPSPGCFRAQHPSSSFRVETAAVISICQRILPCPGQGDRTGRCLYSQVKAEGSRGSRRRPGLGSLSTRTLIFSPCSPKHERVKLAPQSHRVHRGQNPNHRLFLSFLLLLNLPHYFQDQTANFGCLDPVSEGISSPVAVFEGQEGPY